MSAEHVLKFAPRGWHTVTPRIFTGDVAGLVGFLKTVLNAGGDFRVEMPSEIKIGDSIVMISDGNGLREPLPAFLCVYVENVDETYRLTVSHRAKSVEQPAETPYGDRRATVLDDWGNTWQIATCRTARRSSRDRAIEIGKTTEPSMTRNAQDTTCPMRRLRRSRL